MKKICLIVLCLCAVLYSCKPDNEINVEIRGVENITQTTAECTYDVTYGDSEITETGVCWGTSQNPTKKDNYVVGDFEYNSLSDYYYVAKLEGLSPGTQYYVRAYVANRRSTIYGEELIFTTDGNSWNEEPEKPEEPEESFANETITVKGVSFTMIAVEGGTFQMGAQRDYPIDGNYDSDAYSDESPVHSVTLSSYYIGETEVTQELWEAVMGNNPSYYSGYPQRPVEYVSWNDCQEFITKLNQLTGKNFRLPTEAEWEYAARGGNKSNGYKYSGSNTINNVAWYTDNCGSKTHDVKTKAANELGIYDMSGNVWEWCQDWYGSYSSGSQTNPTGPTSGSLRVNRGGSWSYLAKYCRVSDRDNGNSYYWTSYDIGFRLVL